MSKFHKNELIYLHTWSNSSVSMISKAKESSGWVSRRGFGGGVGPLKLKKKKIKLEKGNKNH